MNVSMPPEIRRLVRQGAISTAAVERTGIDDSSWVVRAIAEKLVREWDHLGVPEPLPDGVQHLAASGLCPGPRRGCVRVLEGAGA
jgi:hypothetical protein